MRSMAGLALSIVALMFVAVVSMGAAAGPEEAVITIESDGVVRVVLRGSVEAGLNRIPLPAEPIIASIVARVNGSLVASFYENGTLYVPSDGPGNLEVEYVVDVTIGKATSWFEIATDYPLVLQLAPNIILVGVPEGIKDSTVQDGYLRLLLQGPTTINYTITNITSIGAQEPSPAPPGEQDSLLGDLAMVILLGALAAGFAAGGLALARRRRAPRSAATVHEPTVPGGGGDTPGEGQGPVVDRELLRRELDSTDLEILRYLEDSGGNAYQAEVGRVLGLPKATLSRRVAKLARLGVIRVEREGKLNRLILEYRPWGEESSSGEGPGEK